MWEQMEIFQKVVEGTRRTEVASPQAAKNSHKGEVKLMKLSDQDDIGAYLTTFEHVMRA